MICIYCGEKICLPACKVTPRVILNVDLVVERARKNLSLAARAFTRDYATTAEDDALLRRASRQLVWAEDLQQAFRRTDTGHVTRTKRIQEKKGNSPESLGRNPSLVVGDLP